MKTALIAALSAMTEAEAVLVWELIAQATDNQRNYVAEADSVPERDLALLKAGEIIERAGDAALAALAE